MKYHAVVIGIMLALPALASAEIVIQNGGSIESHTSSSASTGGNDVGEGGSVVTGNASASSKSEVTSDGDGTDVHIETSTTVNGETKTQTIEKTLKAGEPVSVEVNSKSVSGQKATTSVKINGEAVGGNASGTQAAEDIHADAEVKSNNAFISVVARISVAIKSFFSIFKFW